MQKDTNTSKLELVGKVWRRQVKYLNTILKQKKKTS